VKALYWTAVINGLLTPFLLVAILVIGSDNKLMQANQVARLTRYPDWGENQWDSTALPISVGNRANSLGGFGDA
jgi:Mn2+/Fe2+ NRAMP family transporter